MGPQRKKGVPSLQEERIGGRENWLAGGGGSETAAYPLTLVWRGFGGTLVGGQGERERGRMR